MLAATLCAALALLGAGLRPDAFYAGDPGVKLIAARNAVEHPGRPLEIPLPSIAGAPLPYVDPFFSVHGDHSHAVTSELFPDAAHLLSRKGTVGVTALVLLTTAALWTDRNAYRELRGAKQMYGRLIDFVSKEVPPGGHVVTDIWWLHQIAATLTADRRFIYVPNAADGQIIVSRLSGAVVPSVTVIRSELESPDTGAWRDGSCCFEEQRSRMSVRAVVAIRLRHRCGSGL